jgi:hypothetical protein
MDLNIHDSYTLQEVQAAFNNHFPNLKLEFFNSDPARKFDFSKENLITDTHKTLAEVRHIHRTGHISINGHQKVSTLEKHFGENFGINIQVFRKSGNTWLQTTATDEWTLAEQNKKGEEMNQSIREKASEEDIHEQQ